MIIKLKKRFLKIKLPKDFTYRVSSVRIKFFSSDLYADVVYEKEIQKIEPKGEYRAGIDIGLDELLAGVSENPELKSFIASGKEIKGFNQWFNKEKAKIQSQMDCLKNKFKTQKITEEEKELQELEIKQRVLSAHRKRLIDTQFHRMARKVVDILYETGHKVIYIGKNVVESKNEINLEK